MPQVSLTNQLERALEQSGINVVVEERGDTLILSGQVDTEQARQAAEDIVADLAPGRRIDNGLDVQVQLPESVADQTEGEASLSELPELADELQEVRDEANPDFTDQPLLTDPSAAPGSGSGEPGFSSEDPVADGEEVYVPPMDPVITTDNHGQARVLGGFAADSMAEVDVPRSASDGQLGDEAIEDAVRQELLEDAATTDLTNIRVVVRQGVAHLIGTVPTLDDAENAEAVAARVPGVREVIEDLDVPTV